MRRAFDVRMWPADGRLGDRRTAAGRADRSRSVGSWSGVPSWPANQRPRIPPRSDDDSGSWPDDSRMATVSQTAVRPRWWPENEWRAGRGTGSPGGLSAGARMTSPNAACFGGPRAELADPGRSGAGLRIRANQGVPSGTLVADRPGVLAVRARHGPPLAGAVGLLEQRPARVVGQVERIDAVRLALLGPDYRRGEVPRCRLEAGSALERGDAARRWPAGRIPSCRA